jgi:thioredoxin-related protein
MKLFYTIVITLVIGVVSQLQAQEINWMSWDEAVALQNSEENPKKMFIDVYTDWCKWCKVMDQNTFQNPKVATYMNENFYMVKLDAEGKEPITYDGKVFKFVPNGRSGYHELALALLQGKLSYPTVVFLDEGQKMLAPLSGYQEVDPFLKVAIYFGDNIYKTKDWPTYVGQ